MGSSKASYHRQIWCILLLVIQQCVAVDFRNILAVNTLPDGEIETRINYKKISAKETTVGKGSAIGLKYRQIHRGNNLLQLIYDGSNTLTDCEFVNDEKLSKTFLNNFKQDLSNLIATSNVSIKSLEHISPPKNIKSWLSMKKLRRECRRLHSRLRTEAERMKHLYYSNSTYISRRSVVVDPSFVTSNESMETFAWIMVIQRQIGGRNGFSNQFSVNVAPILHRAFPYANIGEK
ncbi:hypothetical protein HHI36_014101 [Cryptolaemus montrouzieri]|uniref:Uncharacterized protein n=1 Tax=Cryptolaemus montrouzieri TaxID=559131 RepID=A0ABD2N2S3_9CUCU